MIRGALEVASWRVTCVWERDPLVGGAGEGGAGGVWALRLTLVEHVKEHYPFSEE